MKKKWLQSFGGVDDKYVHEAAPSGAARTRSGKTVRIVAILAACMAFVMLSGTVALFIPFKTTPPSVAAYADSPYYGIIEKFNEYNYTPPAYKNTAEWLWHLPGDLFAKAEDFAPTSPGQSENLNGNYQEVTDNQVAGVIEADHIKRSDTHIFYLYGNQLRIYTIEGEESQEVAIYDVDQYGITGFSAEEFFLSKDCKTVTVICSAIDKDDQRYINMVRIVTLDVSDLERGIREISHVDVSGQYLSSRLTEHGLLLMTNMRCTRPNYKDQRTFIPHIIQDQQMQFVIPESIVSPDTLSTPNYTVMVMMDATGREVKDSAAFLSYSEDVFVSEDAIYASRSYRAYGEVQNNVQPWVTVSDISCMGYGADGFDVRGSVTVNGSVLNQYSMDEHEGTLRVVTTTNQGNKYLRNVSLDFFGTEADLMPTPIPTGTSADLYVIDLATMEIAASVKQFAPRGETVRSARFDGNMAYVCTAVQQTDPVFFFDLSDLSDIKVKETGTIAGFSTSLVDFGDGFLLGIGRGQNGNELKIEIYTEGEDSVESFTKYERPCTDYSPDYKAYYIDRENGLVGLGIYTWDKVYVDSSVYKYENYRYGYIVLHFDGETLREVLRYEYGTREDINGMRGVYIDGYYYVFNGTRLDVSALELDEQ